MNVGVLIMNRNQAKEFYPILQAFAEGKIIEMSSILGWVKKDDLNIDLLMSNPELFRIKPEPKYRPFKNAEECWNEMQKHEPFGWVKIGDWYCTMREIRPTSAFCHGGGDVFHYEDMVEQITFVDGTPFGIKEEE